MEAFAIVGISFRLPQGITRDDELWQVLESGENLSTRWPSDRATIDSFCGGPESRQGQLPTDKAHFLSGDIAAFDAPFFSITAQEAEAMDPQQRWSMETAYHAFENAGMPVAKLRGSRTAVYAASGADDSTRLLAKDPDSMPRMAITGTTPCMLANRLSWYFDLHGPSMHIDTACSSSLTAMDAACQALLTRSASQALIIGSSLLLSPELSLLLSNMQFLSPDGICHTFDSRANGYARGEGIIAMVIKPLATAVQDRDPIRAVIRGIGVNQDGHTPGLTQPSANAQESLIKDVYSKASLGFESTRYFEAHGTGTILGDRTEIKTIGKVFKPYRSRNSPIYVGSVKTNVGHLEGASGLAGILKSILMLEKGIIVPNAGLEEINPAIKHEENSVMVLNQAIKWPDDGIRRISITTYGFGGSNAHAILDDTFSYLKSLNTRSIPKTLSPTVTNGHDDISRHIEHHKGIVEVATKAQSEKDIPYLLVWSANDATSVRSLVHLYETYYKLNIRGKAAKLCQLAYTLSARRSLMSWRAFAIVNQLQVLDVRDILAPVKSDLTLNWSGLALVFTGQGAQYPGMGMKLMHYPVFQHALVEADAALSRLGCTWSLFDKLLNGKDIHEPQHSQPLCTALQVALVSLLGSFDICPASVVGHSSGEIAAAYAIGALSLESAMKIAFHRGLLVGNIKAGLSTPEAMISVNIGQDSVESYLQNILPSLSTKFHVSCVNSPVNCTLSGAEKDVDLLLSHLEADQIFAVKLRTGVAYHSPTMQKIALEYMQAIGYLHPGTQQQESQMVSSVTGDIVPKHILLSPLYWVNNLVSTVQFTDAVTYLLENPPASCAITQLVEIGPHSALRRPIQDIMSNMSPKGRQARYLSVLDRYNCAATSFLSMLGNLFCAGFPVPIQRANQSLGTPSKETIPVLHDCPSYPFNHTRSYWSESRIARDYRLRKAVPSDSLGMRSHDWNPLEPRWRNRLSVERMPWIGDHVVNDTVLYPGVGMLVMGVEAVKQVALPDRRITGFRIKEANFLSPITFGELPSDVTESVVHLRFMSNTYEKESSWFGIAIYSYSGDHWTKCSTMRIQVQYHEATPHSDTEAENELEVSAIQQRYKRGSSTCSHGIETRAFYAHSQQNGLRYGDSFQVLREIRWDGKDGAVARIMPSSYHYKTSSLVHPAILDAALQISVVQTSKGLSKRVPTMVPSQMHDTWLSAEGWNQPQSSPLRLISSVTYDGKSGFNGKMAVLSKQGAPLFTIDKVTVSPLSSIDMHAASEREQTLIHQVQWNPQLSLQSPDQLDRICNTQVIPVDSDAMLTFFVNLEAALIHMSGKAVRNLNQSTLEKAPAHLRKLAITLRHQIESYRNQNSRQELSDRQAYEILDRSEQEKPGWRIFAQVARNLESIFRGSVDALDLIFTNDLADTYYRSLFDHCCDQRLRKLVELMAHENPRLQIIEVGAGTGAMTRNLLSMLNSLESETGTTRFESFAYTDISPSFFENAKNEFRDDRISFHTLDIERDPSKQGFQPSTYDLVIAGGVIHATKSLERTLKNVKSLLKPGGKLLFAEIIAPKSIHATVGFGILPGWWLAEEGSRAFSPCVSEHQWDEALKIAGFSGTDVILRDYETEECHIFSIMASTCLEQSQDQPQETQSVVAIVPSGCGEEDAVAKEIARLLGSKTIVGLREAHNIQLSYEDIVVVLAEIASPLLVSMDEQDFLALQYIISRTSNLIWVTQSSPVRENYPHFSLMTGFLRTLRLETPEKKLVGLSIESDDARTSKELASYISKVIQASFKEECLELEYTVREGHISTARVVEDIELDNKIQTMLSPQLRQESIGTGPPMVLSIGNPGNLDTLRFVEDAPSETELGEDELEVEPRAWSINFRDVIVALGRLPGESFGCDCAGVVTKVGRGSPFQPGDRVGLNAPACMRTCVKTTLPHAFRIPDSMGFNEAASFITPAATAYYCLMTIACLRPREKILIHSAAGATGQMAILIAQHCGAEIFATVGNDEKKELLITKFRIPPSHILYSRNTSFAKGISRLTGGKGVDVVLNSLSGESLRASFDCMAPYGRFIEIGKSDITTDSSLPMGNFRRNVSFFAVDLYHMSITKPELLADIMRHVMDLMSQNVLHYPSPMYVLPVSNIEAGFRSIQAGNSAGRFVIQVDPSDIVPKLLSERSELNFDANASYIIAGGLGGLGRAICKWMVRNGARNLILPSRSGPKSDAAQELLKSLQNAGAFVMAPKCDAASREQLSQMLTSCAETMPPIKGCINAAMELHDTVFEGMLISQWNSSVRAKVNTSWNLHCLLPDTLDFFILLSSLAGVYGIPTQSSYAAGCTFQDSLAHYRNLHSRKSISLDIGWMRTIGIISEREDYQRNRVKARDLMPIEEEELLSLLDLCCRSEEQSTNRTGQNTKSQVLIGATTPSMFLRRGEEVIPPLRVPLFSSLVGNQKPSAIAITSSIGGLVNRFKEAQGNAEKAQVVSIALVEKLARALLVSSDHIEPDQTLERYGVDSLMAIELRNWAINNFQSKVAVFEIMGIPITKIGELIVRKSISI